MTSLNIPLLPAELEGLFEEFQNDAVGLIQAFMPILCDFIKADRIFIAPRNPNTRVCMMMKWRRNESIPWPSIPSGASFNGWIIEEKWELNDPLFRAALNLRPSIYIEDLEEAAKEGVLNFEFEAKYMFHTAFIHGHAHWPSLSSRTATEVEGRQFYGSVQPAVFDGSRVWPEEVHELVEKCLIRIAPVMKSIGETAPSIADFEKS